MNSYINLTKIAALTHTSYAMTFAFHKANTSIKAAISGAEQMPNVVQNLKDALYYNQEGLKALEEYFMKNK